MASTKRNKRNVCQRSSFPSPVVVNVLFLVYLHPMAYPRARPRAYPRAYSTRKETKKEHQMAYPRAYPRACRKEKRKVRLISNPLPLPLPLPDSLRPYLLLPFAASTTASIAERRASAKMSCFIEKIMVDFEDVDEGSERKSRRTRGLLMNG